MYIVEIFSDQSDLSMQTLDLNVNIFYESLLEARVVTTLSVKNSKCILSRKDIRYLLKTKNVSNEKIDALREEKYFLLICIHDRI